MGSGIRSEFFLAAQASTFRLAPQHILPTIICKWKVNVGTAAQGASLDQRLPPVPRRGRTGFPEG